MQFSCNLAKNLDVDKIRLSKDGQMAGVIMQRIHDFGFTCNEPCDMQPESLATKGTATTVYS